jgi:hypothetical protein
VATILQLVPSVGSTAPTLDLNTPGVGLFQLRMEPEPSFPPPPLRRATAGTLLRDGQVIPAAAYDNRTIAFTLRLLAASAGQKATALTGLAQQLDNQYAVLRLQWADASVSTWYRLLRSPSNPIRRLRPDGKALLVDVELLAEPFGLGSPSTTGPSTLNNDPSNPTALQASKLSTVDAGFEASIGGWIAPDADQTVVRSTAQAHTGSASMLVTASNTNTSEAKLSPYVGSSTSVHTCTGNTPHWIAGWVRAVATGRNMVLRVAWYTSADAFIAFSDVPGTDVSGSWTQLFAGVTSPPTAAKYELYGQTLTPVAAEGHYWDDLTMQPGTPGNVLDITGVTGDVDTLPKILMTSGGANMAPVLSIRRHGIVTDIAPIVQAEHMTQGTDTTVGTDTTMSNGQRSRCTFGTVATMATRLTVTLPFNGGFARTAARGIYRLWAAIASSNNTSVYGIRQRIVSGFGGSIPMLTGDTVTYTPTVANDRYLADLGLFGVPVGPDPVYDGYGGEALVGSLDVQIQVSRVSGAGSLDVDFIAALPADEETCRLATTYLDIVLDGPQDAVYTPDGIGAVTAAAVPAVARDGAIPKLTPNQTNRIFILRPDALGTGFARGPDIKSRSTTLTITWNPCYLTWAP